jgi:2-C-methyl-D-erythritol 4-phosphate cytidylyltransferase
MGQIDKVWSPLAGRPVLVHSLARLSPVADATVLVVHPDRLHQARKEISPRFPDVVIVPGGTERQESARLGITALIDVDTVAVHDAARPFAPVTLLEAGARLLSRADGAVPATPVRDTVKAVGEGEIVAGTLDRSPLRAAQTPQLFRLSALRSAHNAAAERRALYTDDAALVEEAGGRIVCFPGEPGNFKITTPWDLYLAELIAASGVSI